MARASHSTLQDLQLPDKTLSSMLEKVVKWYQQHQRALPWRSTSDPYCIWVSEIMLQQTQVATVMSYYERFMSRFPDVAELASAPEEEVLRYWSGLGYYRRARQMHQAAKKIVDQYGRRFPTEIQSILTLPGVGRYTAGAIHSFAYDQPSPIVEANTQRLYSRWALWREPLDQTSSVKAMWAFAERVISDSMRRINNKENLSPRSVNYALMELGALVCKPVPNCNECPVKDDCLAFKHHSVESIPAPKKTVAFTDRFEVALVVPEPSQSYDLASKTRYLLRRCGDGEWWTGLWDFPRIEVTKKQFEAIRSISSQSLLAVLESSIKHRESNDRESRKETLSDNADPILNVERQIQQRFGLDLSLGRLRPQVIRHSVTRFRIQLIAVDANLRNSIVLTDERKFLTLDEIVEMPLSSSGKKVLKLLRSKHDD
jgi:A/G-specific adenine glycosylase